MAAITAKPRGKGRPFQKGVSGNPGGRPKEEHHVMTLARAHTPEAIKALVLALKYPRERVPAAIALLDRGWGKPVQMIAADPERPIAIEFQWQDAGVNGSVIQGESTPNTHTHAHAVAQQIEGAIIDAAVQDDSDTT